MSFTRALKLYTLKYIKNNVFLKETIVALCVMDFLGVGTPRFGKTCLFNRAY